MHAEKGEKVALVVSDRHDNIGMDPIHRAVGDAAGATILIDAGDDTSAGQRWEEFSLRSLNEQFKGYTVVAVAGKTMITASLCLGTGRITAHLPQMGEPRKSKESRCT